MSGFFDGAIFDSKIYDVYPVPVPIIIQKSPALAGMGGQWYSYYDLLKKGKKKLTLSPLTIPPAPKPVEKPLPEWIARVGQRQRTPVQARKLEIPAIGQYKQNLQRQRRARREQEVIEV